MTVILVMEVIFMGLADTFKALSDPKRRELLTLLKAGRMNAGDLADQLDISPQTLSYHLRLLKAADLVMEYREKNFVYYELNITVFQEIVLWTEQFTANDKEGS